MLALKPNGSASNIGSLGSMTCPKTSKEPVMALGACGCDVCIICVWS